MVRSPLQRAARRGRICGDGPPIRSIFLGVFCVLLIGTNGCASSETALTSAQRQKLDPALQRLLRGGARSIDRYETHERTDGATVYSVILRSDRPEALRDAGLPLNSVRDDIITARLTINQLKEAARLEAVRSIENPKQTYPTQ